MNKFNLKLVIGICLIIAGLLISENKGLNKDLLLLNINKPTATVIDIVSPITQKITNIDDRAKLAIFNYEFSQRVPKYKNITTQDLNDIYVLAASKFFKTSMKDKYKDLDKDLVGLIESVTTSDNHQLTPEEQKVISDNFNGLSWSLVYR